MTNGRTKWSEAICSSEHVGRFLYARGHAVRKAAAPMPSASILDFLQRLAGSDKDLRLLTRLFYLTTPSLTAFIHRRLPNLLRSLTQSAQSRVETSRRGVRGKILWSQTLRTRMTGRADQSSFVIRRGVKSSDIPENKLLRHFLEQIDETIGEALKFVGESEKGLPNEFRALRSDVTRALKNPYLSEVSRVTRATAQMRQRARRARQAEYRELATLQVAFDRVFRWSRWESILRLVTSGWIEPIKDDDLFELYALVQVLNALKVDLRLGEPVTYGLIRTNRGRIAVFQGVGGMRVDVFFDQAPSTVIQGTLQSEYVGTLSCYEGFAPKQRRPDITLVVTRPGEDARVLFIECKDSDDPEYRYTSVYKALGYVKDFRALWSGHEQQKPKVVLVYPEPVHPKPGGSDAAWDVALVCADDRTRMAALITGVLDHANAP